MKNFKVRAITLVLAIVMLVTWIPMAMEQYGASSYVSTEELNTMLQEALGTETDYVKGIKATEKMTNEWVAVALDRAALEHDDLIKADFNFMKQVKEAFAPDWDGAKVEDIIASVKQQWEDERYAIQIKNMLTHDEYEDILFAKTFQSVKNEKRIKGLGDVTKGNKGAIRRVFSLGIMTGKKIRNYNDKRDLALSSYAKMEDVKVYVDRIVNPENRVFVTTEGKVTRTTKLPSDHKLWGYVLDSVPNWVYNYDLCNGQAYECTTSAEVFNSDFVPGSVRLLYAKPETYEVYSRALIIDKNNAESYVQRAEEYVTSALNYDYREDQTAWVEKLITLIYPENECGESWDDDRAEKVEELEELTAEWKKHKMIYETAWVYSDPGFVHGYGYTRVIAKFRYVSGNADLSGDGNWITGGSSWRYPIDTWNSNKLYNAEYGEWMYVIVDVPFSDAYLGFGVGNTSYIRDDVRDLGQLRFVNYDFLTSPDSIEFRDNKY